MIIYKTITEAKKNKIISLPGIYYFKNKINNKYYIGQAINIRKRFYSHIAQINKKNDKYPIYKAILKYGIDNFEYGILARANYYENIISLKKSIRQIRNFIY